MKGIGVIRESVSYGIGVKAAMTRFSLLIIDVQKKVATLLGISLPETKGRGE